MTSTKFRCCCTSRTWTTSCRQAALERTVNRSIRMGAQSLPPNRIRKPSSTSAWSEVRADSRLVYSLNESLMHGGIKTRARSIFTISVADSERSAPAALQKMDAILVPADSATAASKASPSDPFCARKRHSVSGICLGMHARHHRICAQCTGAQGRQQHRAVMCRPDPIFHRRPVDALQVPAIR